MFDGALRTRDPQSAGNRVRFLPVTPDSLEGASWYGITIRGSGFPDGQGVAQIRDAEIAFARYPLTFFVADTAEVRGSWFHHYRDEAITDFASDATIVGNQVWRGAGMRNPPTLVGRIGIHLAETFGTCRENEVFHQMQKGIWADYGSSWCNAGGSTPPADTLRITGCQVIGDTTFAGVNASGIEVSWACRERDVVIESGNVQRWPDIGIKLRQSSDVEVSCSCVKNNPMGVQHRRDKVGYGTHDGYSKLRDNLLVQNSTVNVKTIEQGPTGSEPYGDTGGLFGGGIAGSGGNLLKMAADGSLNWHLGSMEERTDFAKENGWRKNDGTVLAPDSAIAVHNRVDGIEGYIDVSDFLATAPDPECAASCAVPTPPGGGGSSIALGRPSGQPADRGEEGPEEDATGVEERLDLPTVLALHAPRPNPTRGGVVMRLDVPAKDAGLAEIRVYDVTGRRVNVLLSGPVTAGRHEVSWDLRDGRGRRVGSGVYFARMEFGQKRTTHRIVVLK